MTKCLPENPGGSSHCLTGVAIHPGHFPQRIMPMHTLIRKMLTHPALALGSAVIWGVIEFVALNRLRRSDR